MKEDIAIWKMSRDLVAVKDLKSCQTPVWTWRHISRKSPVTHQFVTIPETSTLIVNIIMKLIFGIYMKNSYFFDISLNIGRSDMKQTAKNSVRPMLSYPFTLFWILTHTFFFFFDVTIFFWRCHLSTYILYSCAIILSFHNPFELVRYFH